MSDGKVANTRGMTPVGTLSYPHLDVPTQNTDDKTGQPIGKPKYSAAIIFPAGTDLSKLQEMADAAGRAKWGDKYAAMKKNFRYSSIRTDSEDKGYPEGSSFINARTEQKPGLVYPWAAEGSTKPAVVPEDKVKEVFYPGAKVRATVAAFAYDRNGNRGVAFALNNMQKVGEGERLDNRVAAENEFDVDLTATPADLGDLA